MAESLVGRSSALSGKYTPDSAREKRSFIFDVPRVRWALVRENQCEPGGF